MSRRLKFIIALVILIILGILFVLGLRGANKNNTVPVNAPTTPVAPISTTVAPLPPAPTLTSKQRAELTVELSIETLARSFTERYGSYSNQNQFENVKDLYPFMTQDFRGKTAKDIAQMGAASSTAQYIGITTRAMSVKVLEQAESSARISVQTQRKETKAAEAAPRIYYQEIILAFQKDGAQWKIDRAEWK